jgi:hypothetical protein
VHEPHERVRNSGVIVPLPLVFPAGTYLEALLGLFPKLEPPAASRPKQPAKLQLITERGAAIEFVICTYRTNGETWLEIFQPMSLSTPLRMCRLY